MIRRVIIDGYRRFDHLDVSPCAGMNVIVGDNESGKSTLLEAIGLALTGRVNGRAAAEEISPFWFHRARVTDYFAACAAGTPARAPEIYIEVYFSDIDATQPLRGVYNSADEDCAGVRIHVTPASDYSAELNDYIGTNPPPILPVEYYTVEWRDFSDELLVKRPKVLATTIIDSRTIRSTSGVDFHTREMLAEHLDAKERTEIAVAHRRSRQTITDEILAPINERIAEQNAALHDRPVGLQMDQSSRTTWESGVVPQVDGVPFSMVGQGQQASVKVALAMSRTAGASTYVLVEEPENHLSYASLSKLLHRLQSLATDDQQLFVTTHSSFVLNRLGLDRLLLLHGGTTASFGSLPDDTVAYFRKLAGYDTLRLVLAPRVALVEGPSDALILERAIRERVGAAPLELGIDILSMGGVTFRRALQLSAALDRQVVALQDNDGRDPVDITTEVSDLLNAPTRSLLVSHPSNGKTLEPQIAAVNSDASLRGVLGIAAHADPVTWMTNNKAEAALRMLQAAECITFPAYINDAVDLLVG